MLKRFKSGRKYSNYITSTKRRLYDPNGLSWHNNYMTFITFFSDFCHWSGQDKKIKLLHIGYPAI